MVLEALIISKPNHLKEMTVSDYLYSIQRSYAKLSHRGAAHSSILIKHHHSPQCIICRYSLPWQCSTMTKEQCNPIRQMPRFKLADSVKAAPVQVNVYKSLILIHLASKMLSLVYLYPITIRPDFRDKAHASLTR